MKIKCMIVDDEPLAIEVLQNHILKMDSLEVVASCQNAFEASEWLRKEKVDLIFMDIQMPGIKGTDFIRTLRNPPRVILTTAYREYALEGYDLDVVDYLVKPISFERFFKSVNKFFQMRTENQKITVHGPGNSKESFIYVRVNKKINKIFLHDIIYAESLKDYITIHTSSQKIIAKHTLSAFEDMLPSQEFLRIHRSFIVSVRQITGFTANSMEISGITLPIGRNYRQQVFQALNYNLREE